MACCIRRPQQPQRAQGVERILDIGDLVPGGPSEAACGELERLHETCDLCRNDQLRQGQVLRREQAGEGRKSVGERNSRVRLKAPLAASHFLQECCNIIAQFVVEGALHVQYGGGGGGGIRAAAFHGGEFDEASL